MQGLPSLILVAVMLAVVLPEVTGVCCEESGGHCGDGTQGTPCCGYGPCNIFCCNCDGGCRHNKQVEDVFVSSALRKLRRYDLNNDDLLDLDEFQTGLGGVLQARSLPADSAFDQFDANKDGFISAMEIDSN